MIDGNEASAALTQAGLDRLRKTNAALLEMLRELEWANHEPGMWAIRICPCCGGANAEDSLATHWLRGHKPDCRLAALLREADGAPAKEKP